MTVYRITHTQQHIIEADFGDLPEGLVREMAGLLADFSLGEGGWSLGDIRGKREDYQTVEVEVEKVTTTKKKGNK